MSSRLICAIAFVAPFCFNHPLGVQAEAKQTAQRCGVDLKKSPVRTYADYDGKGWREYKDVESIPELELNAGAAAFVWLGKEGNPLVNIQEPEEDFTLFTYYCFDAKGNLAQLGYELRTAWGWGYRQEGAVVHKKPTLEISEFFDTATDQHIDRPAQADDIPDALRPSICLEKSQLPFSKLLPKGMV